MLTARSMPKRQTTQTVRVRAPIGGVNAINPGDGECTYAYNLIPVERGLGSRLGYMEWVTNLTGAADTTVPSGIPYKGSASSGSADRLFFTTQTGIWDVSASTDAPTQSIAFTSSAGEAGRGMACTMATTAGRFLLYTDEENGLYIYTESTDTWAKVEAGTTTAWAGLTAYVVGQKVYNGSDVYICVTAGTSAASPGPSGEGTAISDGSAVWDWVEDKESSVIGPSLADQILGYSADPANFVNVMVWKNRVWFTEKNSSRAWYMGVNSLYGTATSFDFGPRMRGGGSLVGLYSWTYDGGSGIDDLLVGLSTSGDVVIYQGTDPSSASTFGLNGCWSVEGLPNGRRVATDKGGDLLILSTMGLVPISKLVSGGETSDASLYASDKIAPILNRLMSLYRNIPGWSMHAHPTENCLIVTVPSNGAGQQTEQWAMSFATRGWFAWRDLPIYSACVWNGELFFGTDDGRVCVHRGGTDNVTLADPNGEPTAVGWSLLTAFGDFGNANNKRIHIIRPTILSQTGNPLWAATAKFGYDLLEPSAPTGTLGSGDGTWDGSEWDEAVWGGDYSASQGFQGASGCGREAAIAIRGSAISRTTLVDLAVYVENGGSLG